jgi:hypothetical protein
MTPELIEALAKAKEYVDNMTPEERIKMLEDQRRAIVEAHRNDPETETRVIVVNHIIPTPYAYMTAPQPDYKGILLSLCASAGLADHMGDMAEDIWKALKDVGIEPPDDVQSLSQLGTWLGMKYGTKTVWGSSLVEDNPCAGCWEPDYLCECGDDE